MRRQQSKVVKRWPTRYKLWLIIAALAVLGIFTTSAFALYQNSQFRNIPWSYHDLCHQRDIVMVAESMGLDYEFVPRKDFKAMELKIIANPKTFGKFKQAYRDYTGESVNSFTLYSDSEPEERCVLNNVKHHVKNINTKLLPYIPNDADHVSYDPNADNVIIRQSVIQKAIWQVTQKSIAVLSVFILVFTRTG